MIEIEYFDDIGKLQADPRAAPALAQARTPFDRTDWWQLLVEECGLEPLIALAHQDGKAVVWPLARQGRSLNALANFYNFEARPLVTPQDGSLDLLAHICRDLAGQTGRLDLTPLKGDLTGLHLNLLLQRAGWTCIARKAHTNHWLDIGEQGYADYLASRDGRLRTTLSRKAKKLETIVKSELSPEDWNTYREIYAASWKPAEASFEFWERFAQQEAHAGRLRFGLALHGGKPVAAQIWTVENSCAFIHKLTHLQDKDAISPGTVLTAKLMQHVIDEDGVETVDFGTGDEPYKATWMNKRDVAMHLVALRRGDPRNWPALAKRALQRLSWRLVPEKPRRYARLSDLKRDRMASASELIEDTGESGPDSGETDARLRAVLADILALDDERVAGFDRESGLFGELPELDSQAVATLLTEIEDRFEIMIDDDDIDGEMLETYGGLLDFVQAKRDAA